MNSGQDITSGGRVARIASNSDKASVHWTDWPAIFVLQASKLSLLPTPFATVLAFTTNMGPWNVFFDRDDGHGMLNRSVVMLL